MSAHPGVRSGCISIVLLAGLFTCSVEAQELRLIRLASRGGVLEFVLQQDLHSIGSITAAGLDRSRRLGSQRVRFAFEGSILHPRLLRFSGRAGMVMNQRGLQSAGVDLLDRGRALEYEFSGALIPRHPFTISLVSARETTTTMTGSVRGYEITQKRTQVSAAVKPIGLSLAYSAINQLPSIQAAHLREDARQFSADVRIPESGVLGGSTINYRRRQIDRKFYNTTISTTLFDTRHRLFFGGTGNAARHKVGLWSNVYEQTGVSPLNRYLLGSDWNWHMRSNIDWHMAASRAGQREGQNRSVNSQGQVELIHRLYHSLTTRLSGALSEQKTGSSFGQSDSRSLDLRYRKQTALGRLEVDLRTEQRNEERLSSNLTGSVFKEQLRVAGLEAVFLQQERVRLNSIAVYDSLGVFRYNEGEDYVLREFGLQTGVERLITGRINDGALLLVDYLYDLGGTALIETDLAEWGVGLIVDQGLRLYYRQQSYRPDQISGSYDLLLSPSDLTRFGTDMRFLGFDIRFEYENQESRVFPFRSSEALINRRISPGPNSEMSLSFRRMVLESTRSGTTRDLVSLSLNWNAIPIDRIRLRGGGKFEVDRGVTPHRKSAYGDLDLGWKYGQTTLRLHYRLGLESFGANDRLITMGQIILQRNF